MAGWCAYRQFENVEYSQNIFKITFNFVHLNLLIELLRNQRDANKYFEDPSQVTLVRIFIKMIVKNNFKKEINSLVQFLQHNDNVSFNFGGFGFAFNHETQPFLRLLWMIQEGFDETKHGEVAILATVPHFSFDLFAHRSPKSKS